MALGELFLSIALDLLTLFEGVGRKRKKGSTELIDDDFGTVRSGPTKWEWQAQVMLSSPDVEATFWMDGSPLGPSRVSRSRAKMLVRTWSDLCTGPIAQEIVKRERQVEGQGPYRTGENPDTVYERYTLRSISFDVRSKVIHVNVSLRGPVRTVIFRLRRWPG